MSVVPPARFADVQREAYRANLEDPLFWEAYAEFVESRAYSELDRSLSK